MGIFGFNKRYDICPKEKELKFVVTNHATGGIIKINGRLVVPKGYNFVIGKKGKVADKFEEGEHFFNFANLPLMCRRYKIDKIENGKQKDKFSADLYFVSKEIHAGKFKTYRKVEMGTKAYGFFKAHVYGVYSYRVSDVKEFMQSLLNEYDYIKSGEAEDIVESWVNEVIVQELEKQNFIISDIIANNPIVANALKIRISKLFSIAGLELIDLKITKYKLPKEYQLESDKNIENQTKPESATGEGVNEDFKKIVNENNIECNQQINESRIINEQITKQEYYKIESIEQDLADANKLLDQFGIGKEENEFEPQNQNLKNSIQQDNTAQTNDPFVDFATELQNENLDKSNESITENNEKTETENFNKENIDIEETEQHQEESYVPFGNFVIEQANIDNIKNATENNNRKKTFVDLSLNELYTSAKETKRCLTCGAENDINANHCILCGEKFNNNDL